MANISGKYNPEAEAQQDFSPLPSGEYLAQIVDSDMKPTKKNDGEYLELEYVILEGDFKGRKAWARINLDNPSDKAVEIAQRQFASVREATGVAAPRDSQDLHYKPHLIRVEFIPAGTTQKNGYTTTKDSSEIKGWSKAEGVAQAAAPSSTPARTAGPQPWQRKSA